MPAQNISLFFYIIYAIMLVVSITNIINPKWTWRTFKSWHARREPTEAYFMISRIMSLITILLVTYMIFFTNMFMFSSDLF